VATLAAGIGSVWLAAGLMRLGWLPGHAARARGPGEQHLLSLAAGALLATAFMHLLPEAMESQAGAKELFATLLVGLVFFFLLDKAELWHHGHEHHHGHGDEPQAHDHDHDHGHASHHHALPRAGGWAVLVAALSVLAHEVPHHISDLVVLRQTSANRRAALLKVSLAGAVTALGGVAGWWLVDRLYDYLPFFLAVASSSFIYVALADLIPQLQKRLGARETLAQIAWLLVGIGLVTVVSRLAHAH
jgi:zinc and cadmium transporter